MSQETKLITINIDGQDIQVPAGTNVIDAATSAGKEIPHFCYHPHLSVSGNCRMCLVELGTPMIDRATNQPVLDENGKPKISFMPKPAIACSTKATPGMHVKTQTPAIKDCQNGVMEFLLVNHPLDCPICDQAGECRLQEFATDYGRGYSRYIEEKNVKPKRTQLGPRVTLDDERCILCSRCVRFSKEIVKDDVLGFIDRGSYSTLACYPGKKLENNYSLNTVDICPVGALTSTDFRFKMRVWFLKPVNSICTESSVGVNTQVWSREGQIYRITPRRNDAVNDSWMADSGRMLYKQVEDESRLKHYQINGVESTFEAATKAAADLINSGKVAYVGSARMSVEEQFLLREIAEFKLGGMHLVYHQQQGDDLLIAKDASPNLRGALVSGLIKELPKTDLAVLGTRIDSGNVDTLFVAGEDLTKVGLTPAQIAKVKIIYHGTHTNATSEKSAVLLPALTVFERTGCFINQQFRIQKFNTCVPPTNGIRADIEVLSQIQSQVKGEHYKLPNIQAIWEQMGKRINVLAGVTFNSIPDDGLLLDGSDFSALTFCEVKSLHYNVRTSTSTFANT